MIALLGSALGFGTSFLPQVLGFFQKKQDHKNRLEELKMRGELAALGVTHEIQKLDKQAEIAETKALRICVAVQLIFVPEPACAF
jgi:hypothetical protein